MIELELELDSISNFEVQYAFRDKRTYLYVGYDGYDTDFSKGISAFIEEKNLISELNRTLITKTRQGLAQQQKQEWDKLGGFDNLDIVKLEVLVEGSLFSPSDLYRLVSGADLELDLEDVEDETE